MFITDEARILPAWLRFVRGVIDSEDLPLNISREMLQTNPILEAIGKAVTGRVLGELEKLAADDPAAFAKVWETFGAVLKEGLYEDAERRDALYKFARFKTTTGGDAWRSLAEYVAALRPNQTAIYYALGDSEAAIRASPQLEGFSARGVEVLVAGGRRRRVLGADGARLRRQAVPLGDAGCGRPRPGAACRRHGSGRRGTRRGGRHARGAVPAGARRQGQRGARIDAAFRQRRSAWSPPTPRSTGNWNAS